MALGTYDENRWSVLDVLRALFTDKETDDGTILVPDAVLSDTVFLKVLGEHGTKAGGSLLAQMYSTYYAQEAIKYADPTLQVTYTDRSKHYAGLAAQIKSGEISIDALASSGRGVLLGRSVVGRGDVAYFDLTGVWPNPSFLP